MQTLGDPLRHLRLMARMGKVVGADLSASFAAGDFDQQDWAAMITRCRGCSEVHRCERFLAAHEQTDSPRSIAPMEGCRNAARLTALRDRVA
jgi:hypothetical protein